MIAAQWREKTRQEINRAAPCLAQFTMTQWTAAIECVGVTSGHFGILSVQGTANEQQCEGFTEDTQAHRASLCASERTADWVFPYGAESFQASAVGTPAARAIPPWKYAWA